MVTKQMIVAERKFKDVSKWKRGPFNIGRVWEGRHVSVYSCYPGFAFAVAVLGVRDEYMVGNYRHEHREFATEEEALDALWEHIK